jgi:penicillin-binding protein 1A
VSRARYYVEFARIGEAGRGDGSAPVRWRTLACVHDRRLAEEMSRLLEAAPAEFGLDPATAARAVSCSALRREGGLHRADWQLSFCGCQDTRTKLHRQAEARLRRRPTPVELAAELGISASTLRAWLRHAYPRGEAERRRPWSLSEEQVAAARARWRQGSQPRARLSPLVPSVVRSNAVAGAPGGPLRSCARRRCGRQRRRPARVLLGALLVGLLTTAAAGSSGLFTGLSLVTEFRDSCSLAGLRPATLGESSFVYSGDGSLLGAVPAERHRQPLHRSEISPWLMRATLAIEDRGFFAHRGLDYQAIARAAWIDFREEKLVQGGSTITQQLVRNLYLDGEPTVARKLEEACLALALEDAWPKTRILTTYLNRVYYGNHAYGAEAAAQTYFGKRAGELGPAQAALLAGLPQAPSLYEPFRHSTAALARRNAVLAAMLETDMLRQSRYERLLRRPLNLRPGGLYTRLREVGFFSYVRDELVAHYGVKRVRESGLRIDTTIDRRLQRLAESAITEVLDQPDDPAAAVVAINPRNGAIRAMTAVLPGRRLQFNLAAQTRRQAGSAFKTFVLVEAIRRGINPWTTSYLSAPFSWRNRSEVWRVKTYGERYYGRSTIAEATLRSDNTVYARMTLDLGPRSVASTAQAMGIETKLEPVPSIGLGVNAVSPLEMASAYATLAAGGIQVKPTGIRQVVLPDGTIDETIGLRAFSARRVLTDAVAHEVTRILEQNMMRGTGTRAAIDRPAAGKTGTTDDFTDAWFIGYTPTLAAAVWVGYADAAISMTNVHGIPVAGGTFPAMIWGLFMSRALEPTPAIDWPPPEQQLTWRPFRGR